MNIDPFAIKSYSKRHPVRIAYTVLARAMDVMCRTLFPILRIPKTPASMLPYPPYEATDTAVTPPQMSALIQALITLPDSVAGVVVEIGSFRGVTTREFGQHTSRMVYAVDPFQGYGGARSDFEQFNANVAGLKNVNHLAKTSGEAAKSLTRKVAFVFVDAVHDYVNTTFDANVWSHRLVRGGLLAMHDVDDRRFPGTHFAAWRMTRKLDLVCHISGLVILRKS